MSKLLSHTVDDLRNGSTTWRVMMMLCAPALLVGLCIGLIRQ